MRTDEEKKADRQAQARRLTAARLHRGFKHGRDAVRYYRFPSEDTYTQHENGTRGMSRAARTYAEAFAVPEEWLLLGRNPPTWSLAEMELPEEERRGSAEHFLRPWRLFRELTEEDLAGALSVPLSVLAGWESGAQDMSEKWLRRAAEALKTTPGAILDVDPRAVPPSLLDLWLDTAKHQRRVMDVAQQVRTGTSG